MMLFTLLIACQSANIQPVEPAADKASGTVMASTAKGKNPVVFPPERCQQFIDCVCPLGNLLVELTDNPAHEEQCDAGKKMKKLQDMSQACDVALTNLRSLLAQYKTEIDKRQITLAKSCAGSK